MFNFLLLFVFLMTGISSFGQTYTIGSGTTTSATSGVTPFGTLYEDGRMQYLYLASELTAAGMTAGNYDRFAFNITAVGSPLASNFNLKIGQSSSLTTLGAINTTVPMTTVFSSTAGPTLVTGWNTWTFSAPFAWDGTSNILIEACFDNAAWSSNSTVQTTQFAAGISNTFGFYADGAAGCSIATGTSATAANRRHRPNAQFSKVAVTPPNCATGFTPATAATGVVRNSTLTWTAATGSPSSYDVYFGTSATPAFVANVVGTSYTPATMSASTTYYWQVVPRNGNGPATGCAVNSFTTGTALNYCQPTITYGCTDGDVIARVVLNTLDNNSGTGCPSGTAGYSNYSANSSLTTTLQAGSTYGCTVYAGQYSQGYAAWIDYNDDGAFSASERIGFSNGMVTGSGSVGVLGSSATFPIVLSCNPPLGQHRLRVRSQFNTSGADLTACGNSSYGEIEDYTITITAADACPQPSGLAHTQDASGIHFTWNPGCVETNWQVVVQAAGAGVPTGAGTTASSPYTVTGLASGAYEFYVRANCLANGFSSWNGPHTFAVLDCPVLQAPANAATNVALDGGQVLVSWAAAANATSYNVFFGTSPTALTNIGSVTGTSVGIVNLNYSTTYYWSVVSSNGTDTSAGCQTFSFTTGALPANDVCSGALSLDALTSPISGSTYGASDNFTPSCGLSGSVGPDLFYSITVPANYTLVIGLTASNYDSVHAIFYGSCGTQTQIACVDTEVINQTWANTTGATQTVYWVQDAWSTGTGQYTLAWTLTPPPVTVTGFTPASVCGQLGGTSFNISGTNFTGTTNVTFNGIPATSFVVNDDTSVTAVSPAGDIAGPIVVFSSPSANGSASSSSSVIVNPTPVVEPITGGNTALCEGETADLNTASPGGTWSSSDTEVATVDAEGLVTAQSAGTATISYSVTDNGCTATVTTSITVNTPVSATNPTSQTVLTGDNAVFSSTVTGMATGYQWQVSTDGGDVFEDLDESAPYSGTQTTTLTITDTPESFNENMYRLIAFGTAPCADFETAGADLIVGETGIAEQPQSVVQCSTSLSDAVFTVVPTGTVVSYAWQVDKGLGFVSITDGNDAGITYSGATSAQLTVSGLTSATAYSFRVTLEGPANTISSNIATFSVANEVAIGTDPSGSSVCYSGGTATFTVAATGTVDGYQWQYSTNNTTFANVANGTPAGATYSGQSTAVLSVTTTAATPAAGTYFYRAIALSTGVCPNATSLGAQLSIISPQITSAPVAASTPIGTSTTFSVATSASNPTYKWQFSTTANGTYSDVANGTPVGVNYSNQTTSTLTVSTLGTAVAGSGYYYRAVVTSAGCSANSTAAQLTLTNYCTPTYANGPGTTDQITNVTLGTLNNPSGASAAPYYTFFSNVTVPSIQQSTTVPVSISFGADGTQYAAVWVDFNRNGTFEASEGFVSTVNAGASGTTVINVAVPIGASVGQTRMRVRGGNDSALTTAQACGVSSSGFGETEDYVVNITAAPACSGTPVAATASSSSSFVCGSGAVTLTATGFATNVTGLSLQWYNTASGAIAGATSATYTTPTLSAPTSYFVRVTCANGGAFSDSNTVNVTISNPVLESTTPATRCGTGTVTLAGTPSTGNTINWYTTPTGGASIASGTSFTTPSLTATTTYYAAASATASTLPAMTYCASTSTSTTYYITGFSTTGAQSNITNTGTVQSAAGYGNYTALAARQTAGGTVNFSVTWPSSTYGVSVFVDWNNDGDFDDAGEKVAGTTSYAATPYTGSFTVPASAVAGNRRMRVRADFLSTTPTACGTSTSSETEDYTFVVAPCESARTAVVATVNTPPVLTLSSASTTICAGSPSSAVTVTSNAADYDSYVWSPATGVSGSAASGFTFNPAASGTYTLTATNTASGCANTATVAVTVNALPDAFTVAPQTLCSTDAAVRLSPFAANVTTGCLLSTNAQFPAGTFSSTTCDGVTATVITTNAWTAEYSVVTVTANTRYVFTSSGAGDYVTVSNEAGTAVLAYGPSPLTYVSAAAGNVRFYSQLSNCTAQNTARSRSFTCSPAASVTWSPTTGLYTDAAATVPYSGGAALSVYAKPSATQTYTITATTAAGCVRTGTTTVTVNTATVWYVDADNDNYGNSALPTTLSCTEPANAAAVGGDCDDTIAAINPGMPEILYNGVDDNCDGNLDEGNQLLSQVLSTQCGTTLASISSVIGAVSYSAPVNGYRFRVVNTTTNAVQTFDANVPHFQLTQLASYDYATTYSISVMLRRNGVWLGYYGPSCLVSTPAVLDPGGSAAVNPSQCGITLASISTLIATTSIPNVTAYRFRVTNLTDGTAPLVIQTLERTTNWFALTMLERFNYGTQYQVEVAIKTSNGAWSGYGAPCNVSSPIVPMLNNCGATVSAAGTVVATASLNRATAYRFEITNMTTFVQTIVDRPSNYFTFNNVPGYVAGALYGVRVSVQTSGHWSPFGETCTITAPGASRTIVKGEELAPTVAFRAVVYPNPYAESFALDMDTPSNEKVQVKVYDMVGKLIQDSEFAVDSIEMQQFGERYPSGVYNIVVTQAGFVKTLRVIKR
ncbi:GEVED domain-containing protein [Flavobacterium sp.]|uniref:GEVED domain-containing protein n=1 Tax=Flavobacterium sp. TaxID=239 RepID=UPI0025C501FF|nr:GEVED domain-containing protein [Flavobacterium sp.]